MNKIKLSIIIPTYNGGEWIEDTIRSVLYQLPPYRDDVEFIVRDNCSTDSTESIVERLNQEYKDLIIYEKRRSNIIADINYREAVQLSHGDYFVLLGDDDLLFPNFIWNTLELIRTNEDISYFYYNRITTSRQYHGAKLKHIDPSPSFYKVYNNAEAFIRDYPSGPDFMSVNVIKRKCFDRGINYVKEKYYGVEWYSIILYGIKGQKCMSLFSPMILQRVPRKRVWDDRQLLFVVVGVDNLFSDISQFYPSAHQSWLSYSDANVDKIQCIFNSIPLNRPLYREKWGELAPKLNAFQKCVAYILLKLPFLSPILKLFVKYPDFCFKGFRKLLKMAIIKR